MTHELDTQAVAAQAALREGRGDVDALVALGVQCLSEADAQSAAAFARAARYIDTTRIAPVRLLGHALLALGEHALAADTLAYSLSMEVEGADPARSESRFATLEQHSLLGEAASRIALGHALLALSCTTEAIAEFEASVKLDPSAHALTCLGSALAQARRYPEALQVLNRVIGSDPQHGPAYTSLGDALIAVGRPEAALVQLKRALELDTARAAPALAFGQALVRLGQLGEALPWFNRALEIEPANAEVFRQLGRTLAALRLDKEALDCIRAARQLRGGDWPDAWMDEAGLLLRRGDFRAGWRAYENREFAQRLSTIVPPVWNGDDEIAGESLLLIAEQGLGDTFQFIRFAPRVAALGVTVTVEVQPPLKDLFKRCYAGTGVEIIARGEPQPAFTRQNSLVGMPHALQAPVETYADDVPYLFSEADRAAQWRMRLTDHASQAGIAPVLRVGIVASGNPLFRNDADRSMPLAMLSPLLARTDIQWVIVQPELRERDRATLAAHPHVWWTGDALRDFDDTAALIDSLDLLISVDTGVAHLCGAMGKPVWILLPHFGDWRWLHDRADSPWYPSARLFRQPRPQDWHSVVDAVSAAIASAILAR